MTSLQTALHQITRLSHAILAQQSADKTQLLSPLALLPALILLRHAVKGPAQQELERVLGFVPEVELYAPLTEALDRWNDGARGYALDEEFLTLKEIACAREKVLAEARAHGYSLLEEDEIRDMIAYNTQKRYPPDLSQAVKGCFLASFFAAKSHVEVTPGYKAILQTLHSAQSALPDQGVPGGLNAWISEHTKGLISEMIGSVDDLEAVLGSTLYYAASWDKAFSPQDTKPGLFQTPQGPICVPMMRKSCQAFYSVDDNAQVLQLPLQDGTYVKLSLPRTPHDGLEPMAGYGPGHLVLPMLDLHETVDLKQALQALGLKHVFTTDSDWSPLTPNPHWYLDKAQQRCVLKMDEEGVVGGAVTLMAPAAGCGMPSKPPIPFLMVLDRPFSVNITHHDMTVFLAYVADPGTRSLDAPQPLVDQEVLDLIQRRRHGQW